VIPLMDVRVNQPTGDPVDITCLVDTYAITHGRDDASSQPDASTCTLDLSWWADTQELPVELDVGSVVVVRAITHPLDPPDAPSQAIRFSGKVTDIALGWDDQGEATPDRPVVQVIAAGALGDLGRRVVGDAPFPQELDGARVSRILGLAGMAPPPAETDPGTVQILARDIDSQAALDVIRSTAESANGVLWQRRDGTVLYADADHRRGTPAALRLDACDVLVTPTWRRNTEGLINDVSVGYGVAPEGGEEPRYLASRADSIAVFGTYGYSLTTELAALADATALGQMLLTRNSQPVWILDELPIDIKNLSEADTQTLLGLQMHSLLELTGLPAAGRVPSSAFLWVEGWHETGTYGDLELVLTVSGYCRTAPAPRWDDVAPGWLWDAMTQTWDQMTCLGPLPTHGRWTDVPATLRWDQVPAGTTWDTWTM
jgi:hypothetical protein